MPRTGSIRSICTKSREDLPSLANSFKHPHSVSHTEKGPEVTITAEEAEALHEQLHTADYNIDPFSVQDAAKDGEDYVEFRTMGWIKAGLVSTAESIALGLLSFPSVFYRLGMVGGVLATVGIGLLAYLTAWIMVDFKMKHMGVMHMGDSGGVMWGRWGSIITSTGMILKCMGLAGSHVLVGQTALGTIGYARPICAVWYTFLVMVVSIMMSHSRQWGKLTWMSFISIACILIASMITIVATGIQSPSVLETPKGGPIVWRAFPKDPSLMSVLGGFTNIIFAYGGNMGVFSFCSEMRRPQDFKKSFIIVQGMGITCYTLVGALVYAFGGQYVTSPALTMTSRPVRITAYAIAMVTIMVSGILAVNIGAKLLYMAALRKSELLTSRSWKAEMVWIGMVSFIWILGFIVAEVIPFFNSLLTIVSSLFSVWFSFGFAGFLWFYSESPWWGKQPGEHRAIDTKLKKLLFATSVFTIILSVVVTPLGMYSAVMSIIEGYSKGTFKGPFHC